eukprot:3551410-Prymnesium_polylepis.1
MSLPTTPDAHVVHVSLQPDGAFGLASDGVVRALMLSTDASPSDVLEVRGRVAMWQPTEPHGGCAPFALLPPCQRQNDVTRLNFASSGESGGGVGG